MSADIVAVVIVSITGGGGLLGFGPCHSRRPCATHLQRTSDGLRQWVPGRYRLFPEEELGLPVWWDGGFLPEGWDVARRIAYGLADSNTQAGRELIELAMVMRPTLEDVEELGAALVVLGWGARVARLVRADAHGRLEEVSDAG